MNKSEIADRVAGRMGLGKSDAAGAVDAVFAEISEALAIPASMTPVFKAGKALKESVKGSHRS